MTTFDGQPFCDAYFKALIPQPDDTPDAVDILSAIPLPPGPNRHWFWNRVHDAYQQITADRASPDPAPDPDR